MSGITAFTTTTAAGSSVNIGVSFRFVKHSVVPSAYCTVYLLVNVLNETTLPVHTLCPLSCFCTAVSVVLSYTDNNIFFSCVMVSVAVVLSVY